MGCEAVLKKEYAVCQAHRIEWLLGRLRHPSGINPLTTGFPFATEVSLARGIPFATEVSFATGIPFVTAIL